MDNSAHLSRRAAWFVLRAVAKQHHQGLHLLRREQHLASATKEMTMWLD